MSKDILFQGVDIKNDDLVTPEIIDQEGQTIYRYSVKRLLAIKILYKCWFLPDFSLKSNRVSFFHAGWFHCKFTNLGFNMKGAGEVLYSTVLQKSSNPIPANCYPAGPLYDIRCVQGELCELKLPHCETSIGELMIKILILHSFCPTAKA